MEAHLLTFFFFPSAAVYTCVNTRERVFWRWLQLRRNAVNLGQVGSGDKTRTNTNTHTHMAVWELRRGHR